MDKNKLYGEPNAEVKAVEEDQALQDETEKASLTSEEQREAIRETIRRRRQQSWVSKAIFYPAKPKPSILDEDHKEVAVYARVSTTSKEQTSSIENQTQYYTEKIAKNPNWSLQHIYSDEGKSGTSMKHRKDFRQMLMDAGDKKMDLILCASVSRFARNVSDCIDQVRILRTMNPSHPVGVYFETENIYTLDPDCDQGLQIHALLADWESANKSRRMILSYDQRICTGQYPVLDLLGLRHTKDGDLLIEPEEAKTVRYIFLALMCGDTFSEVADMLTAKKRPTLKGRTEWTPSMVRSIISNERRWGDLRARKTIVIDYKAGKVAKNDNIRDAAFIEGHHIGIVTPEIAKATKFATQSSAGISEIGVISRGALKGFVSVSPGWSGVDNETFEEVCCSVYSADERQRIELEARINSGEEHSKVYSMELTGYEVPPGVYYMKRSTPSLTLSSRGFSFNRVCHERLGYCKYVEVLYHPILQTIAVRSCDPDTPNAFSWETIAREPVSTISAKAYMQAIYDRMGWIRDYKFRFRGVSRVRGNAQIIFFNLEEPRIIPGKGRKAKTWDAEENMEQYIPYRLEDKPDAAEHTDLGHAYPSEWKKECIGVSYAIRSRRDALVNAIQEADILESGIMVTNPMIGVIPSMEEIQEELDQLLMSM